MNFSKEKKLPLSHRVLGRLIRMFVRAKDPKQKKPETSRVLAAFSTKARAPRAHNPDDGSQAYDNGLGSTYDPNVYGGNRHHHHGAGLPSMTEPMGDHEGHHANNPGGHHGDHQGGHGGYDSGGYSGGNDSGGGGGGGGDSGGGGGGGGGGD